MVGIFLWLGDEETATSANLVFDAAAPKYFTTAELYTLGIVVSERICNYGAEC
jgi:hypothetical protein